jgi:CDGSH-type Zn-finger protein
MARLVRIEAVAPVEIQLGGKSAWVCACGLSQDLPYCDGSHGRIASEEPGKCYVYDAARRNVVEVREDDGGGSGR